VSTHAPSSHAGLPTSRATSAETMKMPDPIIETDDDHRRVEEAKAAC
jgi:hypothetical protein